ncbi:EF-hand domain-containing member C2 [Dinochytrium kinnereticum]|nr:EF-hand domain-containing member C2 [Dinochytrium kinnereticum]
MPASPESERGCLGPEQRPLASGFYFRKRTERLDWRMLASIHVEKLQREVDLETLQRVIENVTFCDVESEGILGFEDDVRYVDPNFIKLFQLSQLIIEYLLHSQDYLSEHREKLLEECETMSAEMESIKSMYDKEVIETKALKKENRALRKTIYAYQLMVKVPTSSQGNNHAVTVSSYHRCEYCPKVFKSDIYLDNHMLRRHPEVPQEDYRRHQNPIRPQKRLDSPQPSRDPHDHAVPPVQKGMEVIEKVTETMERFSSRILEVERQLKNEMEMKLANELGERQARLEDKYKQERLRYEKDLQELKSKALEAKKSTLGRMEDDEDDDKIERARQAQLEAEAMKKRMEMEQKAALQSMKSEFQTEIDDIRRSITKEANRDKRKLEEKLEEATRKIVDLHESLNREKRRNNERETDFNHSIRTLEADLHHNEKKMKEAILSAPPPQMTPHPPVKRKGTLTKAMNRKREEPEESEAEIYNKKESKKEAQTTPKKSPRIQANLKISIPPPPNNTKTVPPPSEHHSTSPDTSDSESDGEDVGSFEGILHFFGEHSEDIKQKEDHQPLRKKLREVLVDNIDEIIDTGFEGSEHTSDIRNDRGRSPIDDRSKVRGNDRVEQQIQDRFRGRSEDRGRSHSEDKFRRLSKEKPQSRSGSRMREHSSDRIKEHIDNETKRYGDDVFDSRKADRMKNGYDDKLTSTKNVEDKGFSHNSDRRLSRNHSTERRISERKQSETSNYEVKTMGKRPPQEPISVRQPLKDAFYEEEPPPRASVSAPKAQKLPVKSLAEKVVEVEPPPKVTENPSYRFIDTITEESEEKNEKKSEGSFDVSELSQLSEGGDNSDSWSEPDNRQKSNPSLKLMNESTKSLTAPLMRYQSTPNASNRKTKPQSDTFSDFDSDSESFGGTKLTSKASNGKQMQSKHAAFVSTANGRNIQNVRKFSEDRDEFSMEDSDLESSMSKDLNPALKQLEKTLPFLPGHKFELEKFELHNHRKSHAFDYCNTVPVFRGEATGIGGNNLPGQTDSKIHSSVLRFYAYFQEAVNEKREEQYRVRKVNIYFYLEDDTIHVSEPKTPNSGIPQGTLIRRHRIPKSENGSGQHYIVKDLNVDKEVTFYSRTFKIVGCDDFTREFLAHLRISVPKNDTFPQDPYEAHRNEMLARMKPTRPSQPKSSLKKFLENDRRVLRFYCVWDDTNSVFGDVRHMVVHYYLSDDTIEIRESIPANSGRETNTLFLRRCRLPKHKSRAFYGQSSENPDDYFSERDLTIGSVLHLYGRPFVICDCDEFTKDYYREKYGLEDFDPVRIEDYEEEPLEEPPIPASSQAPTAQPLIPSNAAPKKDFKKLMMYDGVCLRYSGVLKSLKQVDRDRKFVISLYLADDTISVFEPHQRNSGIIGGKFLEKQMIKKPGTEEYYGPQDFYIGAELAFYQHPFVLTGADEYAIKFMDQHQSQFPKHRAQQM